jgi:glycerol-3-phosphate cytidylyltransferase-like family protein
MAKVVELGDYGDEVSRKPKRIEGKRQSANDRPSKKVTTNESKVVLKTKPASEAKVKKKVKPKSTDVGLVNKTTKPGKPVATQLPAAKKDTSLEDLDSQFVDVLSSIPDSVRQENEQIQEYIRMFDKLRRIARMTEKQVLRNKSTRGIYPLMQVYREMREVIADLRALRDVGQMGELLNDEVLNPFAQSCVTSLVNLRKALLVGAKNTISDPTQLGEFINLLDANVRSAGIEIDTAYRNSLSKTIAVFNGGD